MSDIDTQEFWLRSHRQLESEAARLRNSQSVAFGLLDLYDQLSESKKHEVHSILSKWLLSNDNKLRYDAEFLISQRLIRELRPAVETAIERLHKISGPEAKDEVKKLDRIKNELINDEAQ